MIVLPFAQDPDPSPALAPVSRPAPLQSTLRVLVFGFSPSERKLIQGVAALSQRRSLHLELTSIETAATADVVLLDGEDERVMKWAARTDLLAGKTVIQVDGRNAPAGAIHLQRPIQWPSLPALLQQAMDPSSPLSTRQPLSA